jgi:hypothetical protein
MLVNASMMCRVVTGEYGKISRKEVKMWGKNLHGTTSSTTKFAPVVECRLVIKGQQLTT